MMLRSLWGFLATVVLCGLAVAADQPLSVSVQPTGDAKAPGLEFTVTNTSSAPISIFETDLPWEQGSVRLVALPVRKEPLAERITSEDHFRPPPTRVIPPGESAKGRMPLSADFQLKDIDRALVEGRLILFWYYAPHTSEGKGLGEYGGWTVLQQIAR